MRSSLSNLYFIGGLLTLVVVGGCGTNNQTNPPSTNTSTATASNSSTTAIQPAESSATQVFRFTPTTTLPSLAKKGSCFANSIATPLRSDVWRCTVGNEIFDPCFVTQESNTLLCGVDLENNNKGFKLQLIKPLPEPFVPSSTPENENAAWLVELADGKTFCPPFTGTRAYLSGEYASYGCSDPDILLGDLKKEGSRWFATEFIVNNRKNDLPILKSTTTVFLKTVWQ